LSTGLIWNAIRILTLVTQFLPQFWLNVIPLHKWYCKINSGLGTCTWFINGPSYFSWAPFW
jgi:hypothetical protein